MHTQAPSHSAHSYSFFSIAVTSARIESILSTLAAMSQLRALELIIKVLERGEARRLLNTFPPLCPQLDCFEFCYVGHECWMLNESNIRTPHTAKYSEHPPALGCKE